MNNRFHSFQSASERLKGFIAIGVEANVLFLVQDQSGSWILFLLGTGRNKNHFNRFKSEWNLTAGDHNYDFDDDENDDLFDDDDDDDDYDLDDDYDESDDEYDDDYEDFDIEVEDEEDF